MEHSLVEWHSVVAGQIPHPTAVFQHLCSAAACVAGTAAALRKKRCLQGGLAPSVALAVRGSTLIHRTEEGQGNAYTQGAAAR